MKKIDITSGVNSGDSGPLGGAKINDNFKEIIKVVFGKDIWDGNVTEELVGFLATLPTNNKSSLFSSLVEIYSNSILLDDSLSSSILKTWSIDKLNSTFINVNELASSTYTQTQVNDLLVSTKNATIQILLDNPDLDVNSISEVLALMSNADATLTSSIAEKLSFTTSQSLTTTQKNIALTNLGVNKSFVDGLGINATSLNGFFDTAFAKKTELNIFTQLLTANNGLNVTGATSFGSSVGINKINKSKINIAQTSNTTFTESNQHIMLEDSVNVPYYGIGLDVNKGLSFLARNGGNWSKALTLSQNNNATFIGGINAPSIKLTTGAVDGYYLRTDASGNGSWQPVSASQVYKGTWDANTNTPNLADGTGTTGFYYRCTVAGTVDLGDGNITFAVGDDVIYNGSEWERIPGQGYNLQKASSTVLGGVKVGSGLAIDASGVLSNALISGTDYLAPSSLTNYVDRNTSQTISGAKTFSDNLEVSKNVNGDASLKVTNLNTGTSTRSILRAGTSTTGVNLTAYGNNYNVIPNWVSSTGITVDSGTSGGFFIYSPNSFRVQNNVGVDAFKVNSGNVYFYGNIIGNGSGLTNLTKSQITDFPTDLSEFTNDLGNYGNFLVSADLNGFATESWVNNQNYLNSGNFIAGTDYQLPLSNVAFNNVNNNFNSSQLFNGNIGIGTSTLNKSKLHISNAGNSTFTESNQHIIFEDEAETSFYGISLDENKSLSFVARDGSNWTETLTLSQSNGAIFYDNVSAISFSGNGSQLTNLTKSQITDFGTYDNYDYFQLQTNSINRKQIGSENVLNFIEGAGIDITYSSNGSVNIATNFNISDYFKNDGSTWLTDDLVFNIGASFTTLKAQNLGISAISLNLPTTSGTIALTSDIPSLSGYATESYVNSQGFLTTHQDLSNYALTSSIPTNNNALTNGANYITNSALSGLATETYVDNKINNVVQSISSSATISASTNVIDISGGTGDVIITVPSNLENENIRIINRQGSYVSFNGASGVTVYSDTMDIGNANINTSSVLVKIATNTYVATNQIGL
ncbi:hypothetical protein H9I45_15170 [Polaribacter haliotis]|uniref:Uncharacterized protein n=1 Tax=Polaribacter haliotis TaxID=1888915 RepID=A0A7L8AFC1_9FLAO|nr:hypothetical protein [Polaribacter haliotis]QOD60660.1 hypothetical protein H9I45_15170 [Polaribacter haliotis]